MNRANNIQRDIAEWTFVKNYAHKIDRDKNKIKFADLTIKIFPMIIILQTVSMYMGSQVSIPFLIMFSDP